MTPKLLPRDSDRPLALFVGGGTDALAVVEPILNDRAYDVEFVDADDEPYGTVRALKPDIVVVSLTLGDDSGFQLLTMLRLDPTTASIPVLSYLQENDVHALGTVPVDHRVTRLPSMVAPRAQRH